MQRSLVLPKHFAEYPEGCYPLIQKTDKGDKDAMSDVVKRRMTLKAKAKDLAVLEVLRGIPGYLPQNDAYSIIKIDLEKGAMEADQTDELQSKAIALGKRDNAVAEEKKFHELILGAIDAVKSQFGEDSNEYQALGRKKKSEHKSPKRKPKVGP